jgi:hypothetical protein
MDNRAALLIAEINEVSEQLFGGTEDRNPLTLDATRMTLEIASQIISGAIIPLEPGRHSIYSITDRATIERLSQPLTGLFSPKNCKELCEETLGFSQVRSSIVRHCDRLSALGCFVKGSQEFTLKTAEQAEKERAEGNWRSKAGQFLKGSNFGKKHCTEIYEINIRRLLIVEAACIRRLKQEHTDSGIDGWQEYGPSHGCAYMAYLWNKLIGIGTIYGGWENWHPTDEADRATPEQATAELEIRQAGLEQNLSEQYDRLKLLKAEGRKASPWFWDTVSRLKSELDRVTRSLAARIPIERPPMPAIDLPF